MQVVILAWWLGTRLRPITETIPKPMVEVNNKPFLFYQIEMLRSYWFTNILILAGYLWHMIEEYFWNWNNFWVSIKYSYEKDTLLWTGGALKLAENLLEDEFIIINWDSYLWFNYNELVESFHNQSNLNWAFTVYNNSKAGSHVKSNLLLKDGIIAKYEKWTDNPELQYVDAWVIIMKKNILNSVSSWEVLNLEADLLQPQIGDKKIWYYETTQMFYDIGTFDRLSIFKDALNTTQ